MKTLLVTRPDNVPVGTLVAIRHSRFSVASTYFGSSGYAVAYLADDFVGEPLTVQIGSRGLSASVVLPSDPMVLVGKKLCSLAPQLAEWLRVRELGSEDRLRHEAAKEFLHRGVNAFTYAQYVDVSHSALQVLAAYVGVTIPAMLTITLGDASTDPTAATKWAIHPEPPKLATDTAEYAEGYGVDPGDRVITSAVIVDTLNALGVSVVALTPTDQTLAGSDGLGMLYLFTHGPDAEDQDEPYIRFSMPNMAARLDDLVPIIEGRGIASAALDIQYNDIDVVFAGKILNFEGSGISTLVQEGTDKATITIPGLAGTTGFYVAESTTYTEVPRRLQFNIAALLVQPGAGTFIFTQLPLSVPRNRTERTLARINDFIISPLYDRDLNELVPSQLTPGRWFQVLYVLGAGGGYVITETLDPRPQDYRVYGGYTDPNTVYGEVTYDATNFTFFTDTDLIVFPAPPDSVADYYRLIAFPVNTGDMDYISTVRAGFNTIFNWYKIADNTDPADINAPTVAIAGNEYYVWSAPDSPSRVGVSYYFTQEYP